MEGSQNRGGIAFRSVKLPLPVEDTMYSSPPLHNSSPPSPLVQGPSFCFNDVKGTAPKPLLDIEDVRAFIQAKLGYPKPEIDRSSTRRIHTGVFGIGTMGHSGSDGGYVPLSSPQANEHQGEISSHSFVQDHNRYAQDRYGAQNAYVQHSDDEPPYNYGSNSTPLLDINDVRFALLNFLHRTGLRRHPTTSLANKLPWHVPRARFLARGLEWPPDKFESEEARKAYYRRARKRKPFMLGSPPLWTVTAFNLGFLRLLMYNPFKKFSDFLSTLP